MDRLIATNSVPFANADTAPATGTPQYATSGNPATSTPATVFPAYAWNMLQDEIYAVIIAAGLTPNRNAWNQLLTAIQTMLQGSTTNVGVDTGAANAYVVAFTPALSNPVPWVPFWFEVAHTNTGASTLNATGTVEPLVGAAHTALQGGEMLAKGNALVYWNPTLAAGAGSYVLLFCSGASEQIAPATQPGHALQLQQNTGIVGTVRNLKASLAAAGTSLTITADEIGIKGALAGQSQIWANVNASVSTSTTNAIGGVVGTALTASGYAGIYAAFNPSTLAFGFYGKNANSLLPNVDTSLAGWIGTLVSAWPLNGSTQFVPGLQIDRDLAVTDQVAATSAATIATFTAVSIAGLVPPNARTVSGSLTAGGISVQNAFVRASGVPSGFNYKQALISAPSVASPGSGVTSEFQDLLLSVPQTIYWLCGETSGSSVSATVAIHSYKI